MARAQAADAGQRLLPFLPPALLAVLALYCLTLATGPGAINGDTSWLITVVERMARGERVYIDILETNPPMAFLIYWPAVRLAGLAGVSPEMLVFWMTGGVALGSIGLCALQLRHVGAGSGVAWLPLATLAVVFLLAPSRSFTQREHLALILLMPAVLGFSARAEGGQPPLILALVCGVAAGIGASIKPHFVLIVTLPALAAAIARRDWRLLFAPEALAAAMVFAAYVTLWITVYGAFFDLPLFLTTNTYRLYAYDPQHYLSDLPALIFLFAFVIGLMAMANSARERAIVTAGMALVGFAVAFIEQGKGFAYHLYPVASAGLIVTSLALGQASEAADAGRLRGLRLLFAASCLGAALSAQYSSRYPDSSDLARAITAVKQRPSLIIMTFDIAVNFPLARDIGATWASRLQSTWISNSGAHALRRGLPPEQRERTLRAMAMERDWLSQDIASNRPDIVVFDGRDMLEHMLKGDSFRQAFDGLHEAVGEAQNGRFLIYRRKGV